MKREVYRHPQTEQSQQQLSMSIADELMKLANLKENGIFLTRNFSK